jgi:hypothetical protein
MPNSIINSDNGVSSGSTGLKTTGGDDGILKIQTNGVDAISVSGSQVVTFANAPVGIPAPASLSTASGSAPSYSARAWVNFNGTGTPAIRASGNVSSITKVATGHYEVNFTTAVADVDYACVVSGRETTTTSGWASQNAVFYWQGSTSSKAAILTGNTANTGARDFPVVTCAVFR